MTQGPSMPQVSQMGHALHSHVCMPTHMLPHSHTQGPGMSPMLMFVLEMALFPLAFLIPNSAVHPHPHIAD